MRGGRPRLVAMAAGIPRANNTSFDVEQPSGPSELSVIFLTDLELALVCFMLEECLRAWKHLKV